MLLFIMLFYFTIFYLFLGFFLGFLSLSNDLLPHTSPPRLVPPFPPSPLLSSVLLPLPPSSPHASVMFLFLHLLHFHLTTHRKSCLPPSLHSEHTPDYSLPL